MNSTILKQKHHHHQQQNQHEHFTKRSNTNSTNNNNISRNIGSHNNNNQNSIFILNTATNNILPNNPQDYYSDLNDNNVVSSSAASSVWSSASSTMCSPAAHAIQKLFNCSSNSLKFNHRNYRGIESKKSFKSNSEILKKKSKFWKYLEAEANEKNRPQGIEEANGNAANDEKIMAKSFKYKSKYWPNSYETDNQNQQDLSELLEYSCSLCDNCRCVDCQIGYFDCENSDDSNSEYSFHLSAYEEDEEADENDSETVTKHPVDLKSFENCCYRTNKKQQEVSTLPTNCSMASLCVCQEVNCSNNQCCQQCFIENFGNVDGIEIKNRQNILTTTDH